MPSVTTNEVTAIKKGNKHIDAGKVKLLVKETDSIDLYVILLAREGDNKDPLIVLSLPTFSLLCLDCGKAYFAWPLKCCSDFVRHVIKCKDAHSKEMVDACFGKNKMTMIEKLENAVRQHYEESPGVLSRRPPAHLRHLQNDEYLLTVYETFKKLVQNQEDVNSIVWRDKSVLDGWKKMLVIVVKDAADVKPRVLPNYQEFKDYNASLLSKGTPLENLRKYLGKSIFLRMAIMVPVCGVKRVPMLLLDGLQVDTSEIQAHQQGMAGQVEQPGVQEQQNARTTIEGLNLRGYRGAQVQDADANHLKIIPSNDDFCMKLFFDAIGAFGRSTQERNAPGQVYRLRVGLIEMPSAYASKLQAVFSDISVGIVQNGGGVWRTCDEKKREMFRSASEFHQYLDGWRAEGTMCNDNSTDLEVFLEFTESLAQLAGMEGHTVTMMAHELVKRLKAHNVDLCKEFGPFQQEKQFSPSSVNNHHNSMSNDDQTRESSGGGVRTRKLGILEPKTLDRYADKFSGMLKIVIRLMMIGEAIHGSGEGGYGFDVETKERLSLLVPGTFNLKDLFNESVGSDANGFAPSVFVSRWKVLIGMLQETLFSMIGKDRAKFYTDRFPHLINEAITPPHLKCDDMFPSKNVIEANEALLKPTTSRNGGFGMDVDVMEAEEYDEEEDDHGDGIGGNSLDISIPTITCMRRKFVLQVLDWIAFIYNDISGVCKVKTPIIELAFQVSMVKSEEGDVYGIDYVGSLSAALKQVLRYICVMSLQFPSDRISTRMVIRNIKTGVVNEKVVVPQSWNEFSNVQEATESNVNALQQHDLQQEMEERDAVASQFGGGIDREEYHRMNQHQRNRDRTSSSSQSTTDLHVFYSMRDMEYISKWRQTRPFVVSCSLANVSCDFSSESAFGSLRNISTHCNNIKGTSNNAAGAAAYMSERSRLNLMRDDERRGTFSATVEIDTKRLVLRSIPSTAQRAVNRIAEALAAMVGGGAKELIERVSSKRMNFKWTSLEENGEKWFNALLECISHIKIEDKDAMSKERMKIVDRLCQQTSVPRGDGTSDLVYDKHFLVTRKYILDSLDLGMLMEAKQDDESWKRRFFKFLVDKRQAFVDLLRAGEETIVKPLMLLIFMTSGGSPRGRELDELKLFSQERGERSMIFSESEDCIVLLFHKFKTRWLQQYSTPQMRVVLPKLEPLLVVYLATFRRIQEEISLAYCELLDSPDCLSFFGDGVREQGMNRMQLVNHARQFKAAICDEGLLWASPFKSDGVLSSVNVIPQMMVDCFSDSWMRRFMDFQSQNPVLGMVEARRNQGKATVSSPHYTFVDWKHLKDVTADPNQISRPSNDTYSPNFDPIEVPIGKMRHILAYMVSQFLGDMARFKVGKSAKIQIEMARRDPSFAHMNAAQLDAGLRAVVDQVQESFGHSSATDQKSYANRTILVGDGLNIHAKLQSQAYIDCRHYQETIMSWTWEDQEEFAMARSGGSLPRNIKRSRVDRASNSSKMSENMMDVDKDDTASDDENGPAKRRMVKIIVPSTTIKAVDFPFSDPPVPSDTIIACSMGFANMITWNSSTGTPSGYNPPQLRPSQDIALQAIIRSNLHSRYARKELASHPRGTTIQHTNIVVATPAGSGKSATVYGSPICDFLVGAQPSLMFFVTPSLAQTLDVCQFNKEGALMYRKAAWKALNSDLQGDNGDESPLDEVPSAKSIFKVLLSRRNEEFVKKLPKVGLGPLLTMKLDWFLEEGSSKRKEGMSLIEDGFVRVIACTPESLCENTSAVAKLLNELRDKKWLSCFVVDECHTTLIEPFRQALEHDFPDRFSQRQLPEVPYHFLSGTLTVDQVHGVINKFGGKGQVTQEVRMTQEEQVNFMNEQDRTIRVIGPKCVVPTGGRKEIYAFEALTMAIQLCEGHEPSNLTKAACLNPMGGLGLSSQSPSATMVFCPTKNMSRSLAAVFTIFKSVCGDKDWIDVFTQEELKSFGDLSQLIGDASQPIARKSIGDYVERIGNIIVNKFNNKHVVDNLECNFYNKILAYWAKSMPPSSKYSTATSSITQSLHRRRSMDESISSTYQQSDEGDDSEVPLDSLALQHGSQKKDCDILASYLAGVKDGDRMFKNKDALKQYMLMDFALEVLAFIVENIPKCQQRLICPRANRISTLMLGDKPPYILISTSSLSSSVDFPIVLQVISLCGVYSVPSLVQEGGRAGRATRLDPETNLRKCVPSRHVIFFLRRLSNNIASNVKGRPHEQGLYDEAKDLLSPLDGVPSQVAMRALIGHWYKTKGEKEHGKHRIVQYILDGAPPTHVLTHNALHSSSTIMNASSLNSTLTNVDIMDVDYSDREHGRIVSGESRLEHDSSTLLPISSTRSNSISELSTISDVFDYSAARNSTDHLASMNDALQNSPSSSASSAPSRQHSQLNPPQQQQQQQQHTIHHVYNSKDATELARRAFPATTKKPQQQQQQFSSTRLERLTSDLNNQWGLGFDSLFVLAALACPNQHSIGAGVDLVLAVWDGTGDEQYGDSLWKMIGLDDAIATLRSIMTKSRMESKPTATTQGAHKEAWEQAKHPGKAGAIIPLVVQYPDFPYAFYNSLNHYIRSSTTLKPLDKLEEMKATKSIGLLWEEDCRLLLSANAMTWMVDNRKKNRQKQNFLSTKVFIDKCSQFWLSKETGCFYDPT